MIITTVSIWPIFSTIAVRFRNCRNRSQISCLHNEHARKSWQYVIRCCTQGAISRIRRNIGFGRQWRKLGLGDTAKSQESLDSAFSLEPGPSQWMRNTTLEQLQNLRRLLASSPLGK